MGKFNGISGHVCGFKPKACAVCSVIFVPKSGINKFCSDSCRGKWKYVAGTFDTEAQYKHISGNWRRYFTRLCCRSQKRENLTADDLLDVLEKQKYRCALSGEPLTCKLEKGTRFLTNASIDRIEAGGPYVKDNIQLICAVLNCWRAATPVDEFVGWCIRVANHAQQKGRF